MEHVISTTSIRRNFKQARGWIVRIAEVQRDVIKPNPAIRGADVAIFELCLECVQLAFIRYISESINRILHLVTEKNHLLFA